MARNRFTCTVHPVYTQSKLIITREFGSINFPKPVHLFVFVSEVWWWIRESSTVGRRNSSVLWQETLQTSQPPTAFIFHFQTFLETRFSMPNWRRWTMRRLWWLKSRSLDCTTSISSLIHLQWTTSSNTALISLDIFPFERSLIIRGLPLLENITNYLLWYTSIVEVKWRNGLENLVAVNWKMILPRNTLVI